MIRPNAFVRITAYCVSAWLASGCADSGSSPDASLETSGGATAIVEASAGGQRSNASRTTPIAGTGNATTSNPPGATSTPTPIAGTTTMPGSGTSTPATPTTTTPTTTTPTTTTPTATATPATPASTDALYAAGFALKALAADPIPVVAKPAAKATGLDAPSYVDPVYGTRVYRATDARDFPGATLVRHDYSRRQAFNATNSRYIATTSNGYWVLYDANSFRVLPRSGAGGSLKGLAGDAEPIWHPTDPATLFYNAGMVWYSKNVETDVDTVMADFRGRLPWPGATQVWTKAEGTSSADGRYWAFMATSYDSATQQNRIHGLLTYDRVGDRIVGTLDAAQFGNAFPDHISISPSGQWAIPSWAYDRTLGTRAYSLDFSSSRQLAGMSEHSDLAIGPAGEDLYVYTDYDLGAIRATNIATGQGFDLLALYPRTGSGYAAHVSGKAFGRAGWVVVSTYADTANYGASTPDPLLQPMHRKVMLLELKPGGRALSIAHTRAAAGYGGYFGEHHATISRDGTRVMFATNFDDGGVPSSYVVVLPSTVYR